MPDLIVDTREHKDVIEPILKNFDTHGITYEFKKLDVGDYQLTNKPEIVVDRKHDLTEVVGNVTQEHDRFRREMERAIANKTKLVILIEHGHGIKSIDDVRTWVNPRIKHSPHCTSGPALARTMETQELKYGIKYEFCEREETGERIMEILRNGTR